MAKRSLGLIGVGAFGRLAARHLAPYCHLVLCDAKKDLMSFAESIGARLGSITDCCQCDFVVLAVPVQKLRETLIEIAPLLKSDALVLDVCSVKMKPLAAMEEILPKHIAIVGTHPLFGPQSGEKGIKGLNIAICDRRGDRVAEVVQFCVQKLELKVFEITPEEHDREAAYVQGLTHLLAKVIVSLDLPEMRFPTQTYQLMQSMVEMVRYDSDDVFRAIEAENPFSADAKKAFFAAARKLEETVSGTLR